MYDEIIFSPQIVKGTAERAEVNIYFYDIIITKKYPHI